MSLFAVAGVSGHTGRVVAETLLAHGHDVRVIVRDAAKGEPWKARGATVAVADVENASALASALKGADGAYLLVPPNMTTGNMRAYQARVGKSLVEAVKTAAIPHVVLLSSVGAQETAGTGPIAALHPIENALRDLPATGATFLRAAYFMENLQGSFGMLDQGVFPTFAPKDAAMPMIATQDIGEVAAGLLLEGPPAPGKPRIVELGSAPYSASDVAAGLSKRLGKVIAAYEAPVASMAATLSGYGMPADVAALYQEMTEGAMKGLVKFEGGHRRAWGKVTLDAFLAAALPAK